MKREDYYGLISEAKRIVIKVGTSTLTHPSGKLNLYQIEKLVRQIMDLSNEKERELLLVSSGAVGAGMGRLGLEEKPRTLPARQAVAAVGQGALLHFYEKLFAEYGQIVAQLLLTRGDLADRIRFINARNTLQELISRKILPIINENDTVAVEEIKFGDNDTLAALVAGLVDADLLILLTDTEGLYTADPRLDSTASLLPLVEEITPEITGLAGGSGTKMATGGMATKVSAAKMAVNAGIPLLIANSKEKDILRRIMDGENLGTLFVPREVNPHAKKRWIAFGSEKSGILTVDFGARKALLENGKSLLPSGVVSAEGKFTAGQVVAIIDPEGKEFARGITNFSREEIDCIKGIQCKDIEGILGHKDFDEIIHTDNMMIIL